jgi:hypothetical protein
MNTVAGESSQNPTLSLKAVDTVKTPELQQLDDSSFHRFVPTGYTIKVNLPLVRNTKNALFAINIDGFIPVYNVNDGAWATMQANMSPVQYLDGEADNVEIFQDQTVVPILSHYYSHRFISGNVNVSLRVTSNTTQPGNMMISQASGLVRDYYDPIDNYDGLRFTNSTAYTTDYTPGNFIVADMSLNRNINIATIRKDPNSATDLAWKLYKVGRAVNNDPHKVFYSTQFQEDWLFFSPLSDFPNNSANQLVFSVFFDYSNVQFYTPMFPFIALGSDDVDQQILVYSDTFISTRSLATTNKNNAAWLPS